MTNLPSELLWGDEAIEEELCGLRFRISPNAFLQTNTAMAERLYGLAGEYAGSDGRGNRLGSLLRDRHHRPLAGVGRADGVGIEVSEESVARAIENADLNGITNTAFFAGNVGEVVEELLERSGRPDVVVVDPPRAGLAGKALRRLGRIGAPRIVYVSCNPTTLASDVKRLRVDWGYRLARARPVDMFPTRRTSRRSRSSSGIRRSFHRSLPRDAGQQTVTWYGSPPGSSTRRRSSRTRRQMRSAFGARNATQRSGSAGRPPIPNRST